MEPITSWFSNALKLEVEENTGAESFASVTDIVMFCVVVLVPSVTETVAVYEALVS